MTDTAHRSNPFQVTKAVDFSDEEIVRTWVDLPGSSFYSLANPSSRMPLLLLGGKGSGRTHLMRYYSAVSQRIRNPDSVPAALIEDGYLGIYVRCSGLNSGRFAGKGQTTEAWADVFAYYTDLWLAQHTLGTVQDMVGGTDEVQAAESQIAQSALSLFDLPPDIDALTLTGLTAGIHALQRELDISINNASLTRSLPVTIRATRGALVLDLPAVIADQLPTLSSVQFTYLLDELENLTLDQQKYINTLIREKRNPCGFIIGSRLYGIRTYETYASAEENKEGSEFESTYLDRIYLREKEQYERFCRDLVVHRLADFGFIPPQDDPTAHDLAQYFEGIVEDRLGRAETEFVRNRNEDERAYLKTLRSKLETGLERQRVPGITARSEIDQVIELLSNPEYPLIEKLNSFLLYQDWYRRNDLTDAARKIADWSSRYVGGENSGRYHTQMGLFRSDLLAQLLREYNQKQRYFGFNTFVHMSSGLPRNLVILLKNVFRWSVFDGEDPFVTEPVSLSAQREGVLQSANWFYDDAPGVGDLGRDVKAGVDRLAALFRSMRFADKPAESSLSSFSVDLNSVTHRARDTIRAAEQWSMLMPVDEGQRDRNTGAVVAKFQLTGMLAPRWDLPIYRRGTVALRADEVNAVFDPSFQEEYAGVVRTRVNRLNAPFFGPEDSQDESDSDPTLF